MKSLYAATRISLADPLHLILGARYTNWRVDTLTYSMEKNHTTPYAGLIYDINDNLSLMPVIPLSFSRRINATKRVNIWLRLPVITMKRV